jgi:hypothetical protein
MMIGKWARRWNRTVTSLPPMVTVAGMSTRSRKIVLAWASDVELDGTPRRSQEGEHVLLASAAHRDEVPFDDRMLAVERDRMEVEVEGGALEQVVIGDRGVLGAEELDDLVMANARRVTRRESSAWESRHVGPPTRPASGGELAGLAGSTSGQIGGPNPRLTFLAA